MGLNFNYELLMVNYKLKIKSGFATKNTKMARNIHIYCKL